VADCLEDQFKPNETNDQFGIITDWLDEECKDFAIPASILVLSQCQAPK
jgi:hypothetical protein